MMWEIEGIRHRGRPKKDLVGLYCITDGMESSGLSQKDAQFSNKWRRGIKGSTG